MAAKGKRRARFSLPARAAKASIAAMPLESDDTPREVLLERILRAERSGDQLMAADQAAAALERFPDDAAFRFHHILSLARAGALTEAEKLWPRYALPTENVNYAALGARLLRERAFRQGGDNRAALARAAAAYQAIFARSQETFPGINAAVLHALAGQQPAAETTAGAVLALLPARPPAERESRFQLAADELQASLILGEMARADAAASRLLESAGNKTALASTRRQLKRLVAALGRGGELAERLKPGLALHYSGHILARAGQPGRFPAEAEAAVAAEIEAALDRLPVDAGFGSLAAGADILVAESLLRRGCDLTVVLPFDRAAFIAASVAPAGEVWVRRFDAVLARASNLVLATEGDYLGDAEVFGYCARLAMGLARLRAAMDEGECHQLAVWDGQPGNGVAGTAADIEAWRGLGLATTTVDSHATGGGHSGNRETRPVQRPLRAFLFGDLSGFSRLGELELLAYNRQILPELAEVIDGFGEHVEIRHTWGDGIYLVFDQVAIGAACALALQARFARLDLPALGLPASLGLRAALHAGPVFPVEDPVMRQRLYTGRHISRAARMEPVTPEGQVYVSEAFAALLALEAEVPVAYEYVGRVPLAKAAGYLRMYLLTAKGA